MSEKHSRRGFMEWAGATAAVTGMGALASCGPQPAAPANQAEPGKRYKAAFSTAGLKATWCAYGMDTAKWWGDRLGIDVVVYDSELNPEKQRRDVEDMATKEWDFVCIQAYAIDTLTEPIKRIIDKGTPVIDMDTLIVEDPRALGLWTFVTPDHELLAELATEEIVKTMEYKGKIVHTTGALGHSGAQARARGFHNVIAKYPDIELIDEQPADWDIAKAGAIWDDVLVKHKEIDGAFVHNDDMATAAIQAIRRSGQERDIVFGSIDGQDTGINGVRKGDLVVSVMNPSGRIHWESLMVGYLAVAEGQKMEDVPAEVLVDSPVITKETADAFQYLQKNFLL